MSDIVCELKKLLTEKLSIYVEPAIAWCNDQGADTIEDILIDEETTSSFFTSLKTKPIHTKKIYKALTNLVGPPQPVVQSFTPIQPNGNIRLLVRLPQSGKTQIMLDSISEFMSLHTKPLIIVVCDNSLLLTTQTVSRGKTQQHINVGKITSNANGYCEWNDIDSVDKPDDKKIRKKNIEQRVVSGEVNTIVLCSNKRRWGDIGELINRYKDIFNIHLWIDEADKTVGGIDGSDSGSMRRIGQLNEWKTQVPLINLITATPFSPKRKWNSFNWIGQNFGGTVELIKIDEIVGEGYHHLRESQFVKQDDTVDNPAFYAQEYLTNNSPKPGDIFLIPGSTKQDSHYEVMDMCLKSDFFDYVILLNGRTKSIESDAVILDKSNPEFKRSLKIKEVAEWLAEWYTEYNVKYKRVAITGNLCISRGITISSKTCQITHMIFSGGRNLRENDQLMSRVCGYCYSAENKPTVVCSQEVWDEVSKYQDVIIELSKMAMSPNHEERVLDENKMNMIIQRFIKSNGTIPVKLVINDDVLLQNFIDLKVNHKYEYKKKFHNLLVNGIHESKITIHDNNINKFDINSRTLKNIRMFKNGDVVEARRFESYNVAFNTLKRISQSCNENEYNIDFASVKYVLNNFVNETNVFWITYRV